jgi:hypothetical protein
MLSLLKTDDFREVRSVYASASGTIWVLGVDWGSRWRDQEAGNWFALRLDRSGATIGPEIALTPGLGFAARGIREIIPVGEMPDRSLAVAVQEDLMDAPPRLAIIGTGGVSAVTGPMPYFDMYDWYLDHSGIAHLTAGPSRRLNYLQVDIRSSLNPVIRSVSYGRPRDTAVTTPGYLRWRGATGFFDEGQGRLLVATAWLDRYALNMRLYRVNRQTLALIDSANIDPVADVHQAWTGLPRGWPALSGPRIVPAGKSGYWIYRFRADSSSLSTTVWAYLVRPDLSPVRPETSTRLPALPFSSTPSGALVNVFGQGSFGPVWAADRTSLVTDLSLEFLGFDERGRVYHEAYVDSTAKEGPR